MIIFDVGVNIYSVLTKLGKRQYALAVCTHVHTLYLCIYQFDTPTNYRLLGHNGLLRPGLGAWSII